MLTELNRRLQILTGAYDIPELVPIQQIERKEPHQLEERKNKKNMINPA